MTQSFPLDPAAHDWLSRVRPIFDTLEKAGGQARVVGGAVRDALMGRPVAEVDFATTLPPQRVMELFKKTVPLGLEHGTVLVVMNGRAFEITTLRRDVQTDGRHAQVAWTDDRMADAARRDFTINALYVDKDGNGTDYFGGVEDIKARRLCFIGDPNARIKEDVLRILRAFRFWAALDLQVEVESLAACLAHKTLLPTLSRERVRHEVAKLLDAPDPSAVCRFMLEQGVWESFLPQARHVDQLEKLVELEKKFDVPPSAPRRFAALWDGSAKEAQKHLALSKKQTTALELMQKPFNLSGLCEALFERGQEVTRDAVLLMAIQNKIDPSPTLFEKIAAWDSPAFPLRGQDLLNEGIPASPAIGAILSATKIWWLQNHCKPTKDECLAKAEEYAMDI